MFEKWRLDSYQGACLVLRDCVEEANVHSQTGSMSDHMRLYYSFENDKKNCDAVAMRRN